MPLPVIHRRWRKLSCAPHLEIDTESGEREGIFRILVLEEMSTPKLVIIRCIHLRRFHVDLGTGAISAQ